MNTIGLRHVRVKVVLETQGKDDTCAVSFFCLVFPKIFHTCQVSVIILSDVTQAVCSKGVTGSDSNKNF